MSLCTGLEWTCSPVTRLDHGGPLGSVATLLIFVTQKQVTCLLSLPVEFQLLLLLLLWNECLCPPPNLYVATLPPEVTVLGSRAFGR